LLALAVAWWTGREASAIPAAPRPSSAATGPEPRAELAGAASTAIAERRAARFEADLPTAFADIERKFASEERHAPIEAGARAVSDRKETLKGRVLAEDGSPMPSFRIVAQSASDASQRVDLRFQAEDGRFEVPGLEAGSWRVSAAVGADWQPASEVRVVALPNAGSELTLVCPRAAALAGQVLDPDGVPVGEADVFVRVRGIELDAATMCKSNLDGSFEVHGLRAGALTLTAMLPGFAPSLPEAFDLTPGAERNDLVLRLRNSSRIQGSVLSSAGARIAGALVSAVRMPMGRSADARTGDDGRFDLPDLAPGTYQVSSYSDSEDEHGRPTPSASQLVELAPSATATLVLGGIPPRPIEVWGHVVSGNAPLAGARIEASPEDDPAPGYRACAVSADDGSYLLEVPRPGNVTFDIHPPSGSALVWHDRVPDEPRWRFDIELPVAHIAGRVVDRDGNARPEVLVELEPDQSQARRFSQVTYGSTETEADGSFRFENLTAGVYTVSVGAPSHSEMPSSASLALGRCTRHGLEVGPSHSVDDVELRLEPPARVRGRVISADRQPLEGGSAVLRDAAGRLMARTHLEPAEGGARFECRNLEAGTYFASAWVTPDGATAPVELHVDAGEERDVELELIQGAFVLVSLADGGLLIEPHVRALDPHGWEAAELLGAPAQQLEKRIGPLAPGAWRIVADDGAGRGSSADVILQPGELRTIALHLD
jgi:Carboxypeptidase regulatory-like domain